MRFLVDECAGTSVARWLREEGHDVASVCEEMRGAPDDDVLALATRQERIVVTTDKDFGEKVFRERKPHRGVILLRLDDERPPAKIAALRRVISSCGHDLARAFVTATEKAVRLSRRLA